MKNIFRDQVVIVTGASSGIGEAAARKFAERGARVVLAARRVEPLEKLAKELPNSIAVPTDVTQLKSVENLVQKTLEKWGRIDILINNAGILVYKLVGDCTLQEARDIIETNFFGCVYCAHAVIPTMKKQKSGVIVNIASIAGKIGFPNLGYYGASKFALVGFSEALRQELKHEGIFVNTICPGTVYTPMTQKIVEEAMAKGKNIMPIRPEKVAGVILDSIEKKRAEVFVPVMTRWLYWLHFFFPKFTEWLAWKFRAAEQPGA